MANSRDFSKYKTERQVSKVEKWMVTILKHAMQMASPSIIENIRKSVQEMVDHAATTENPWDDIFAWLLQVIVGKPGSSVQETE